MRKLLVGLGLLLLVGAAGTFGYRWFGEPARYARNQSHSPGSWRGHSETRDAPRQRDGGSRRPNGDNGLRGLRLFEIIVDLLNIVIGAAGICLAIMGLRTQRVGQRNSLRTDA